MRNLARQSVITCYRLYREAFPCKDRAYEDQRVLSQMPPEARVTGARATTHSAHAIERTVMSGRRPLSRVSLKLLRTSRVRSCLRPVDAGSRSPLALMKIRLALRPNHRIALVAAQTVQRASKPCPLVHITSPSPSMPIALRRNLLLEEPLVRPRPDGRRIDRPSSSARKRCARPCWRAPPRSA